MMKFTMSALSAVAISVLWLVFKSYTDPIAAGGSISRLKAVSINDDTQWLLTRGCNRDNPVLLFIHGGPGMPAMYLAHAFQRPLERDFVVVHWDQRGAGKSFHSNVNPASMTMTQMLEDAEAVIDYLRAEFDEEKVFLVGHSHGTFIGALLAESRPELFHAYVGLGQIGDPSREHVIQDELMRQYYISRGESVPDIDNDNRETLLFEIGGELANAKSFWPLLGTGLMAPEYSLLDVLKVAKGPQFAQEHLVYDNDGGFGPPPIEISIPVHIVMGEQDAVTPVRLAKAWFEEVSAQKKTWTVFENTAHFPHFEQPEKFADFMKNVREKTLPNVSTDDSRGLPIPRFGLHCQTGTS